MKCLCNVRCRILKDIDMFGKEPELYYKTRPKKTSWMGRILSFTFVLAYFAFFLYKFIRMMKKTDVTFYDTFTYADEPPAVPITHNNFYVGFALEDPESYNPFVDEGVYIPKAYFKRAEMKGAEFEWRIVELELEKCRLDKFGPSYQELFAHQDLSNRYCFKDINNYILEGHFSYLLYSFFYIEFFPCINTTDSHNCRPKEIIDHYLNNTFVSFEMEDIELTPKNYESPTRPRNVDVYTTVGKKLFQELHIYFEVVNIETDLDWFGFDEMEDIKTETFLKYDELIAMSNIIEEDIYQTGAKFCDATIKLAENVRTQRRVYVKLITILGDIGGLMEVLFTLFRVISSFSIDILYEISMVNRLFNFDLEKREVILKEPKVEQTHRLSIFKSQEKIEEISKIPFEEKEKKEENEKIAKKSINYKMTRKPNYKRSIYKNDSVNTNMANSKSKAFSRESRASISRRTSKAFNDQFDESGNKRRIIDKVRLNRACVYFLFCFTRRRKILANVLLNEGMDIISSKLDIFNIFDKMYQAEHVNIPMLQKQFPMSRDCKIALKFVRLNTSADASKKYRNSKSSRSSRSSSIYS